MTLRYRLDPLEKQRLRQIQLRWHNRICATNPLNRATTRDAIEAAYEWLGYEPPEIIFVDSPQAALDLLLQFAIPPITRWQWWGLMKLIWHGCWFLPVTIVDYAIVSILFCAFLVLISIPMGIAYWIVTLFLPYLPPPKQSPFMTEIFQWLFYIAMYLAIPVSLWLIPSFMQLVDELTIDFLNKFGLLDRRFRRRFGYSLQYDFGCKLFKQPYADLRTSHLNRLRRTYHPLKKTIDYVAELKKIARYYSGSGEMLGKTTLDRDFFNRSIFFYFDNNTDWLFEVSSLEFKLADFPDLPEFQLWWRVCRDLTANCYLSIPYTKVCIVCDRPASPSQ
jgi:hypothetical protein